MIVEEVHDNDPDREYPAFVFGERCRPPKDAGGLDEFMGYLKADLEPAHEQNRDTVRWYARGAKAGCTRLGDGTVRRNACARAIGESENRAAGAACADWNSIESGDYLITEFALGN